MTEPKQSKAGRKPLADKAMPVKIYPRQSRIDLLGKEKIQAVSLDAVEREYKKELKKLKQWLPKD